MIQVMTTPAPPGARPAAARRSPALTRRLPARTAARAAVTAFVLFVANVYAVSRGEHLWTGPVRVLALALCCLALAAAAWAPREAAALAGLGLLTAAGTGTLPLLGYLAAVGGLGLVARTDRRAAVAGAVAVAASFGLGLAVPDSQGSDTMPSFSDPAGALVLLCLLGVLAVGVGLVVPRSPVDVSAPGLPFLGRSPVLAPPEVLVVAVVVAVVALRSAVVFAGPAIAVGPTGLASGDGTPLVGATLLSPLGTALVVTLFCLLLAAVAVSAWFPRTAFTVVVAGLAGEVAFTVSGGVLYVPPLTAAAVISLYVLGRALLRPVDGGRAAGARLVVPVLLTTVAAALLTTADLLASIAREAAASGGPFGETLFATGPDYVVELFLRTLAGSAVLSVLAVAGAWLVTRWLADRRRLESAVSREAATAERGRIARELHDVVAHHVSLVTVRAESAPYVVPDLPDAARDAFGEIATTSRRALDELRDVLGVLGRPDGAEAERAPQPTLADVAGLVAAARQAGARVAFDRAAFERLVDVADVPAATGIAAHAVVREALSNARRHTPGQEVTVSLTTDDGTLRVAVSTPPSTDSVVDGRPGLGLVGLRERVDAVGGTFTAGPADGRFVVVALLPLRRPSEASA